MRKILSYPLSVLFYFFFFLTLLIFHPIQWLALKTGGYNHHKRTVDLFNFFLMRSLNLLGTRFIIENPHELPTDSPCIFVANHQGMYDIPPIIWYMRKHHPKFVSKKELGHGIPSISFNLRHGGSVLIDRRNGRESLIKMSKFAKYLNSNNRSAVIFPEGTRSRTGKPKKFASSGLHLLIKQMPKAMIVPVTINNSWKLFRHGNFPMEPGVHIKLKFHKPIPANSDEPENLVARVERTIIAAIR